MGAVPFFTGAAWAEAVTVVANMAMSALGGGRR